MFLIKFIMLVLENKALEGLILGLVGLFLLTCAVFDVEWAMRMTRSARRGYPAGRKFTRIMIGIVGFGFIFLAIGSF